MTVLLLLFCCCRRHRFLRSLSSGALRRGGVRTIDNACFLAAAMANNCRAIIIPTGGVYPLCPWPMAPLADSCPYSIVFVAIVWWEHVRAPGRIIVVNLSRGAAQTSSLLAVENLVSHSPWKIYITPPDGVLRWRSCALNYRFEVVVRERNLLAMLIRCVSYYS